MLVHSVLKGVADDEPVMQCMLVSSALHDLVVHYNAQVIKQPALPALTPTMTGKEFKIAFALMAPEMQVQLLYHYQTSQTSPASAPAPDIADHLVAFEERQLRHFALRVLIGVLAFVSCLMMGAVITVAVKSGVMQDGKVANTLVDTATEIIKFILTTSK